MKEYTPEYLSLIKDIIAQRDDEAARRELQELHPADIAELYEDLDEKEAEYLYNLLDDEQAADVLIELDEDDRKEILSEMPAEDIAKQMRSVRSGLLLSRSRKWQALPDKPALLISIRLKPLPSSLLGLVAQSAAARLLLITVIKSSVTSMVWHNCGKPSAPMFWM